MNMKHLTPSHFNLKWLFQKDGSRFKSIYSALHKAPALSRRFRTFFPEKIVVPESPNIPPTYKYIAYHSHSFLNGNRYFPLFVSDLFAFNAAKLFPHLTPEDDIGVIANSIEELEYNGLIPEEISYLSYIRLCQCCGVVSNTAKPKKNPWIAKKHL